jgi:hypothetical protein
MIDIPYVFSNIHTKTLSYMKLIQVSWFMNALMAESLV